jgi:hypothetical protein
MENKTFVPTRHYTLEAAQKALQQVREATGLLTPEQADEADRRAAMINDAAWELAADFGERIA